MNPRHAAAFLLLAVSVAAASAGDDLRFTADDPVVLPAMDTIGVNLAYSGDDNRNGTMAVEYRPAGGKWQSGHPGLRVQAYYRGAKEERREFATRLFSLKPGTEYEVRVTLTDADGVAGEASRTFKVATRAEPVVRNATGRVLHLDAKAAPGGKGTEEAPFATVGAALARLEAGDTVLFHDGEYELNEKYAIVLKASGRPDAPIILRAADGAKPILRGPKTELDAPNGVQWKAEDGGVYSAPLAVKPGQVYFKAHYLGLCDTLEDLMAGKSKAQGKLWPIGCTGGWFWDKARLYVKMPVKYKDWGGKTEDPTVAGVQAVTKFRYGLMPKGKHLVIDGLTFQYFDQPIYLQVTADGEGDGLVVRNCTFRFFNNGIYAYTASSAKIATGAFRDVLIESCDFGVSNDYLYRDWTLGHDVYSTQGIEVTGIVGATGVIRNNRVHDCENGIFIGSGNPDASASEQVPGWVVQGNQFTRVGDDSVELEGPAYNQALIGNQIAHGHSAISMAPAACGPVWLLRNTIYMTDVYGPDGELIKGAQYSTPCNVFKYNSGYNAPGQYILTVAYHNTVLVDTTHSRICGVATKWPCSDGLWWISRNNCFVLRGPDRAMRVYDAWDPKSLTIMDMDYDNVYVSGEIGVACFGGLKKEKAIIYNTFEEFQKAGYEVHGLNHLPTFADPEKGDFRLPPGSPLQDRGVRIPGVNDDFQGAAPDLGACEMPASAPASQPARKNGD